MRMEQFKEKLAIKVAWALPRSVALWAFTRVAAHATQGQWGNEHPDTVSIMTAMGRWDA